MPTSRRARLADELVHFLGIAWKLDCVRHGHVYLFNSDGLLCRHCGRFWEIIDGERPRGFKNPG